MSGTTSPYTLNQYASTWNGSTLAITPMTAFKNIAKGHFSPTGTTTAITGTSAITPIGTVFQGPITGNQLTVTQIYSGTLSVGQTISGDGLPTGLTITSGTSSPYTVSSTLSTPSPNEIMYVSAGATAIGIFRCSVSGTEISTGEKHLAIVSYDNTSDDKDFYSGNGVSKIGVWGVMIQKDALTNYVKSTSGISGIDYITMNLATGTVAFNVAPASGALLTWNGTVHGVSIHPVNLSASFSYTGYPPIYQYIGVDPQVNLSFSDDGGHTFSPERSTAMGRTGNYTRRCIWRRLGMSRDRVYRITCREPVKFSMIGWETRATVGEING